MFKAILFSLLAACGDDVVMDDAMVEVDVRIDAMVIDSNTVDAECQLTWQITCEVVCPGGMTGHYYINTCGPVERKATEVADEEIANCIVDRQGDCTEQVSCSCVATAI